MGILSVYLNNISLDDDSFDEFDPKTIIHVRHFAWHNNLNNAKHLKKK